MKVILASRFDEQARQRLLEGGWQTEAVLRKPGQWVLPEADLISVLKNADCLVTEAENITARVIRACQSLKAVVNCRGSSVNVDLATATEEGVLIAGTPGRNANAVADLTVSLMLMVARNIPRAIDSLRDGTWANSPRATVYLACQGHELPGRTVGLIGLGSIGREVATRLSGFRMRVLAYDPYLSQQTADTVGATLTSLEDLLQQSDFISLHAHLTAETRALLGQREFAMMRPSVYLINTARADLVDEQALMRALTESRIAGAALDVFHKEPLPADHPILKLPNVLALPHIGGATLDVIRHQSETAAQNLKAIQEGRIPPTLINRDVLESPQLRLSSLKCVRE
jgi:phosphoglycerate dehydrogenase-like enzyme